MFFSSWSDLLRILIVGSAAYLALVAILRISGKRTLSKMNAFDLVVTVAFGSALSSTLLSSDVPLSDGVATFALLALLQFVLTRATMQWPIIEEVVKAEPRLLFLRGRMLEGASHDERVTRSEIMAAIRSEGFHDPSAVHAVILESDGSFSVLGDGTTEAILRNVRGPGRTGPETGDGFSSAEATA